MPWQPSNEPCVWRCDRVIASDPRASQRLVEEVLEQLEAQHWRRRDVFGIHLAMEEALVNAIQHGNRRDAAKQVRVTCVLSPRRLRIEIADEGAGFDPALLPDPTDPYHLCAPRGRGVMLMRSFMSRVEYNAEGNRVVLEKERSAE